MTKEGQRRSCLGACADQNCPPGFTGNYDFELADEVLDVIVDDGASFFAPGRVGRVNL